VESAGSPLGAVGAGIWKVRRRGVLILLVSAMLRLCVGSIGLMRTVWGVAGVLLFGGAAAGKVNVHVGAWVMQRIDAAVRGRVSSVLMLASNGLIPVSLGVAGFLIAWSSRGMFLLAGGMILLVTAGASFQRPVREIEYVMQAASCEVDRAALELLGDLHENGSCAVLEQNRAAGET
jgi:hypothetical protein